MIRRLFRSGGGSSIAAPTPTPTPSVRTSVARLPTADRALYDSVETIRAANEWDYSSVGETVVPVTSIALLATAVTNATANTNVRITLGGSAASYTTDMSLPDKDMGTGGILIDGAGMQIDATLTLGHTRKLKFDNIDFIKKGGYTTGPNYNTNTCVMMQTVPGLGSATPGRIVRFGSGARFGRLYKAGTTETADWFDFPTCVSCFHAEQLIFDGVQTNGINFFGGVHGIDLLVTRNCDFQMFVQSLFTGSEAYLSGETKAPVLSAGVRCAIFDSNVVRCQWDHADLANAQFGFIFHTDFWQDNPPQSYGWLKSDGTAYVSGTNIATNLGLNTVIITPEGRAYKLTTWTNYPTLPGAATVKPVHTSGAVTGGDGYQWTFLANYPSAAFKVVAIDNMITERGTVQSASGHQQIAFVRDSSIQNANYLQNNTLLATGNIVCCASTSGLEATGPGVVYSSFNTMAGPPQIANQNTANMILAPVIGIRGSGTLYSTSDIINAPVSSADNLGVSATGTAVVSGRLSCSFGQSSAAPPTGVFSGGFTQQNGYWTMDSAATLNSQATSKATFISTLKAQLAPLSAGTGAI